MRAKDADKGERKILLRALREEFFRRPLKFLVPAG
jgi:hypothetical protein